MFNLRRLAFSSRLLRRMKRGRKKKGDEDQEEGIGDAWKQLAERYIQRMPDDPMVPQQPKKIALQLSVGHIFTLKNDRIESALMTTEEEGNIEVLKAHMQDVWRVTPGLLKLKYDEERVDKWWTGGGFCFYYYYGPMHLNMICAYKVDDLDAGLVEQQLEKMKQNLKNKEERKRAQAEMGCEFLEPLQQVIEESEFAA